jgi:hypothetical protein
VEAFGRDKRQTRNIKRQTSKGVGLRAGIETAFSAKLARPVALAAASRFPPIKKRRLSEIFRLVYNWFTRSGLLEKIFRAVGGGFAHRSL